MLLIRESSFARLHPRGRASHVKLRYKIPSTSKNEGEWKITCPSPKICGPLCVVLRRSSDCDHFHFFLWKTLEPDPPITDWDLVSYINIYYHDLPLIIPQILGFDVLVIDFVFVRLDVLLVLVSTIYQSEGRRQTPAREKEEARYFLQLCKIRNLPEGVSKEANHAAPPYKQPQHSGDFSGRSADNARSHVYLLPEMCRLAILEIPVYTGDNVSLSPDAQVAITSDLTACREQPLPSCSLVSLKISRNRPYPESEINATIIIRSQNLLAIADELFEKREKARFSIGAHTKAKASKISYEIPILKWDEWAKGISRLVISKNSGQGRSPGLSDQRFIGPVAGRLVVIDDRHTAIRGDESTSKEDRRGCKVRVLDFNPQAVKWAKEKIREGQALPDGARIVDKNEHDILSPSMRKASPIMIPQDELAYYEVPLPGTIDVKNIQLTQAQLLITVR